MIIVVIVEGRKCSNVECGGNIQIEEGVRGFSKQISTGFSPQAVSKRPPLKRYCCTKCKQVHLVNPDGTVGLPK